MTANPNIASEGNMNYKNITVAGSGVLGSQIAFQTSYKGFHVNVYDISDQVLGQAKERLTKLKDNYKEDLRATQQTVDEAFSRILQARTSYEIDGYAINGSQKRLVTVGEPALLRFSH